jgi:transcriptional regulator with XRE-family HTH domain
MRLNSPVVDVVATERRLSNRQLALKSGVSPRFLARLRKGQRTASRDTIRRIANVLEIPVDSVLLPHEPLGKEGQK